MDSQNGYRQWNVPHGPGAVLLLVHGLGAHSGRWDAMGNFFADNRIASYAVECPDSGNMSVEIGRLRVHIDEIHPGNKVFLVGESLGALVSFLIAYKRPGLFDGLVCMSPAFKSKLKLSFFEYLNIFTSLIYNPGKQFHLPFDLSMCTRDTDFINRMENDSHEHRWVSASTLVKILIAQTYSISSIRKIRIPTLFLVPGSDILMDSKTSISVFDRLVAKDKTLIEYPKMYHALSIDTDKEKVFKDILGWIEKRV